MPKITNRLRYHLCSSVPEFVAAKNFPPSSADLILLNFSLWELCNINCIKTSKTLIISSSSFTLTNQYHKSGHSKSSTSS